MTSSPFAIFFIIIIVVVLEYLTGSIINLKKKLTTYEENGIYLQGKKIILGLDKEMKEIAADSQWLMICKMNRSWQT